MKRFNKALLFLACFWSGGVFAMACPSVDGYFLKSHDDNNEHCTYHSSKTVKLALPPAATICPRFNLTTSHFQLEYCNPNVLLSKCVCLIKSH